MLINKFHSKYRGQSQQLCEALRRLLEIEEDKRIDPADFVDYFKTIIEMSASRRVSQLPPKTVSSISNPVETAKQDEKVQKAEMPEVHKQIEKLNSDAINHQNKPGTYSAGVSLEPTMKFKPINSPETSNFKQGNLTSYSAANLGSQGGLLNNVSRPHAFSRPGIEGAATVAYGLPTNLHYGGQSSGNLNKPTLTIQSGGYTQQQNIGTDLRSISTEKIGQFGSNHVVKLGGQETPSFVSHNQAGNTQGGPRFFSSQANIHQQPLNPVHSVAENREINNYTQYIPAANEYQSRISQHRAESRPHESRRNRSSSNSLGRFKTTAYYPDIGKTITSTTTVYRDIHHQEDDDRPGFGMRASEYTTGQPGQGYSSIRPSNSTFDNQRGFRPSEAAFDQSQISRRLSSSSHQYRPILPPTEIVTTIEDGDKTHHYGSQTEFFKHEVRQGVNTTTQQTLEGQSSSSKPGSMNLATAFKNHQKFAGPLNSPATKLNYQSGPQTSNFQSVPYQSLQTTEIRGMLDRQRQDPAKSIEKRQNPLSQTPFR